MTHYFRFVMYVIPILQELVSASKKTSLPADSAELDSHPMMNSVEHMWATTTVAVGDTAVLHCSFDALFQQLRNGNIDWLKEPPHKTGSDSGGGGYGGGGGFGVGGGYGGGYGGGGEDMPTVVATGRTMVLEDKRYRVYRPHNSALSVLIVRRARKQDAGVFRCNLSGSSTRHKYMVLNVTDSKIDAQTSPKKVRVKVDSELTLWCNATGYPVPVVYWTREDRHRKLPDGNYQYSGNGLHLRSVTTADTGVYVCHIDNFVQPLVSHKFTVLVDDNPWKLDGFKMRFDSSHWFPHHNSGPAPVKGRSYLLMCETRGSPKPSPDIEWYYNGESLRNNKHYYIIDDSTQWRRSYVSSTLVIMRYMSQFQGTYACVASNGHRMKKQTFSIKDDDETSQSNASTPQTSARSQTKLIIDNAIPARSNSLPASVTARKTDASLATAKENISSKGALNPVARPPSTNEKVHEKSTNIAKTNGYGSAGSTGGQAPRVTKFQHSTIHPKAPRSSVVSSRTRGQLVTQRVIAEITNRPPSASPDRSNGPLGVVETGAEDTLPRQNGVVSDVTDDEDMVDGSGELPV